jgi:putative ABC transport system substrate-binding protein
MLRRQFVGLLGGVAAWPLVAQAQQTLPLIGFMDFGGATKDEILRGLADNGLIEGRNFRAEYLWANYDESRHAAQARSLVQNGASVIIANLKAAYAAKAATRSIPVIFQTGRDAVETGLVESYNRPGGNLTGVSIQSTELMGKRLEILREIIPTAQTIAYIANPANRDVLEAETRELQIAASILGVRMVVAHASERSEIERAFERAAEERADAVLLSADVLFYVNRDYLTRIANAYKLPTIYNTRQYVELGGLASFGARQTEAWYIIGVYAARILKGEKPSELPVRQVATEFVLNSKTAQQLGLTLAPILLARADTVIE